MCYNSQADVCHLVAERQDIKSNVKLGEFWSQLEASCVSHHTELLWFSKTVCLWMTMCVCVCVCVCVCEWVSERERERERERYDSPAAKLAHSSEFFFIKTLCSKHFNSENKAFAYPDCNWMIILWSLHPC